jgi:hypothetical protein
MQLQSYLSLQPESPRLSSPLPRPTLIAHWEIECLQSLQRRVSWLPLS